MVTLCSWAWHKLDRRTLLVRVEGHKGKAVEIDSHSPVGATGYEFEPCVIGSRPGHHTIARIDSVRNFLPNALACPATILANVNASANFKHPYG
jgi:hypothetical protein